MLRKFQTLQNFVKAIPLAEWSTLVSAIYFKKPKTPIRDFLLHYQYFVKQTDLKKSSHIKHC